MKLLTRSWSWVAAVAILCLAAPPEALAQRAAQNDTPPPQGTSRGENFSAKPPAQLFASDCTGAGCHKGPQGLGKNAGITGLAGFLREHYTNSRESAAALANYLQKLPSGPEPRDARNPQQQQRGRATATTPAAAPPSGGSGWGEGFSLPWGGGDQAKPAPAAAPNEARTPRQSPAGQTPPSASRTSRAPARSDDEPAPTPPAAIGQPRPAGEPDEAAAKPDSKPDAKPSEARPSEARPSEAKPADVKPGEAGPKPAEGGRSGPNARAQRNNRQPAGATAAVPPQPPPQPEAAPAPPPPPPAPPPPKEFDIFD